MGSKSNHHHIYLALSSNNSDKDQNFSNWIGKYDISDNTFAYVSSIPDLPRGHVIKDFAMAAVGDSVYFIGGRTHRKEEGFPDVEVEVRSTVLRYAAGAGEWSVCGSLSRPRYNFACTVCDGKIYVAGGQYEVGSARSTSAVEVYDPASDTWTQLPDMKRSRYKCVGVTWKNKVHVVGGFVEGCDVDRQLGYVDRCSAEVYDDVEGRWDLVAGMWQLDVPPNQIVEVEGRLLSSGDCLSAWKGHIEVYEGSLNFWNVLEGSQLKNFFEGQQQKQMQRLYVTMAAVGTCLYFLAGYRDTTTASSRTVMTVHRFDTAAKEEGWTAFAPSVGEEGQAQLCSHCCAASV